MERGVCRWEPPLQLRLASKLASLRILSPFRSESWIYESLKAPPHPRSADPAIQPLCPATSILHQLASQSPSRPTTPGSARHFSLPPPGRSRISASLPVTTAPRARLRKRDEDPAAVAVVVLDQPPALVQPHHLQRQPVAPIDPADRIVARRADPHVDLVGGQRGPIRHVVVRQRRARREHQRRARQSSQQFHASCRGSVPCAGF